MAKPKPLRDFKKKKASVGKKVKKSNAVNTTFKAKTIRMPAQRGLEDAPDIKARISQNLQLLKHYRFLLARTSVCCVVWMCLYACRCIDLCISMFVMWRSVRAGVGCA
jgi:hypothetical protein